MDMTELEGEGSGVEAPIAAVTVFRDGARVQRSGMPSVEPGWRSIVIGNLSARVDPESVRVAADGLDLALLNVEVHGGYRTDPLREEAARLRSEADRCRVPSRRLTMRTPSMRA